MPIGHSTTAGPSGPRPTPVGGWSFAVDQSRTNRQALIVGFIGTVLFHVLFLLVPSSAFQVEIPPPENPAEELDVMIIPEEPEQTETPRFVQTNPNAPENEPDKTDNISDRNQQAANPEPPKELSLDETPARDGQEHPSDQIVVGELNPPVDSPPPVDPSQPAPETPPSNPNAQNPFSGQDVEEARDGEGYTTDVADAAPDPTPTHERVEGEKTDTTDTKPPVPFTRQNPDLPTPAPRPRIVTAPPGMVRKTPAGVSQTGHIGVNARFSQFGEYMARMVEAVSTRWHSLCSSRNFREIGTTVVLRFKLHRDGSITELETVETTSQQVGQLLCRSAVELGSPYGPWTEEMVKMLGDEDVITFTFNYW